MLLLLLTILRVSSAFACGTIADEYISTYLNLRSNITVPSDLDFSCLQAGVHGLQTKKVSGRCSASFPFTQGTGMAEAKYRFNRIPVFAPCQVIVSKEHKFLYVRQPKSASTAVTDAIKETFCKDPKICSPNEFRVTDSHAVSDDMWKDYFVFSVVRNPWTRTASAFTMMNKHFLYNRVSKLQCRVPFISFVKSVAVMKDVCGLRHCCPYIQGTGWVPWFLDQHINDQVGCIMSSDGSFMVDYIGRSESISEDWVEIVRYVAKATGRNYTASEMKNPNGFNNTIENKCRSPKMNHLYNGKVELLASQYAADVVMLGYLSQ